MALPTVALAHNYTSRLEIPDLRQIGTGKKIYPPGPYDQLQFDGTQSLNQLLGYRYPGDSQAYFVGILIWANLGCCFCLPLEFQVLQLLLQLTCCLNAKPMSCS